MTIGAGCVVGAGAVVTGDLEPHGVYAGVPPVASVTIGVAGHKTAVDPRVIIGDNTYIGAGAMVMARENRAITIGRDAAVGAGAVVVDDVDPGARVAGTKARVVSRIAADA